MIDEKILLKKQAAADLNIAPEVLRICFVMPEINSCFNLHKNNLIYLKNQVIITVTIIIKDKEEFKLKFDKHLKKLFVVSLAVAIAGCTGIGAYAAVVPAASATAISTAAANSTAVRNQSTISATSITLGQSITINAAGSSNTGVYTYAVFYKKSTDSSWKTQQSYNSNRTIIFTPDTDGTYTLRVKVKDSTGSIVGKDFTVKVAAAITNKSTLSTTSLTLGQSTTIKAAASGGSGKYTYAVFYKKSTDTKWATKQSYGSNQTVTFKPSAAGTYDVRVKVKDSNGMILGKDFTVNTAAAITNNSKISANSVLAGNSVTVTLSGTGGKGAYRYSVLYQLKSASSWTTALSYGTSSKTSLTLKKPGTYRIAAKIKDENGQIVTKYFDLTVSGLSNTSTINASKITPGSSVTIKASASGGSGSYTYSYGYRVAGSSSWYTIRDYGKVTQMSLTVQNEGEYEFYARVKDSDGTVAEKIFAVTVVDESAKTDLNKQIDAVLSEIITNDMTELEKIKAIHDWLVNNVEYDTNGYSSGYMPSTDFTAEGLFETRVAVCDGYSKAFEAMAKRAGFEAVRITGTGYTSSGSESHAWNQVKVNGSWYNVDVTWDDPIIYGITDNSNLCYTYFLIPDSVINEDHVCDSEGAALHHTCTAEQPTSQLIPLAISDDATQYGYVYVNSTSEIKSQLQNMANTGTSSRTFIRYKENSNESAVVQNDFFPYIPSGYGASASARTWKFADYYLVTITLS